MKDTNSEQKSPSKKKINARAVPSSPLHNASSVKMRQSSELYRQTVIRYDDEEIGGLLSPNMDA